MDRQVGEVDRFGGLLRCRPAAPPDQQLTEAPAYEACVGVESIEALVRIEGEQLIQESGGFGAGPGQDGVEEPEDRREGVGLMQLEEPAAHLAAAGADGEQVEKLLILLRGSVRGQQVLQGGGVEVPVLHSILLAGLL
jgi:hypothetical protein